MQTDPNSKSPSDIFCGALFDVEHALDMYATSFCTLPANAIYDKELLEQYKSIIESCHVYMIGLLPKVEMITAQEKNRQLIMTFCIQGNQYDLTWPFPQGMGLKKEGNLYYAQTEDGQRVWPDQSEIQLRLKYACDSLNFKVEYIGQSYGADGSRNAIDRLLKHETLQKISLKGIPKGFYLSLLLMEILPATRMITVFNPFAQEKDESGARLQAGLDKLFGTSEQEQVALYEASLIRYFAPPFNKEFKDSFPSTNMKILRDCYDKDFAGLVAEICIDELPFRLFSDSIPPSDYHIAKHKLHNDEARKVFFSCEQ